MISCTRISDDLLLLLWLLLLLLNWCETNLWWDLNLNLNDKNDCCSWLMWWLMWFMLNSLNQINHNHNHNQHNRRDEVNIKSNIKMMNNMIIDQVFQLSNLNITKAMFWIFNTITMWITSESSIGERVNVNEWTQLKSGALHYITLHYITFKRLVHCITLHWIV